MDQFTLNDKLLFAAILLIALSLYLVCSGRPYVDDALITYRYAENIAQGNGFTYNPGEKVLGTTTPLYTLILSVFASLNFDLLLTGNIIGILSGLLCCLIIYLLAWELTHSKLTCVLSSMFLAIHGHFIKWATSGMETTLFTLSILTAFYLFQKKRYLTASFISGLAFLIRPDGLIVGLTLFVVYIYKNRKFPWGCLLTFFISVAPWLLFSYLYFHSFLPNSMAAKQGHLNMLEADRFQILQFLIRRDFLIFLPFIPIAFIKTIRQRNTIIKWLPLYLWATIHIASYIIVGIDFRNWYAVPLIPVLIISASFGIASTIELPDKMGLDVLKQPKIIFSVILLLFISISALHHSHLTNRLFRRYLNNVEELRTELGMWLHDNTEENSTIATSAIGHIGYYSKREIIDTAGLITLAAVNKHAMETVNYLKPDYIIEHTHSGLKPLNVLEDPYATKDDFKNFHRNYFLLKKFVSRYSFTYFLYKRIK